MTPQLCLSGDKFERRTEAASFAGPSGLSRLRHLSARRSTQCCWLTRRQTHFWTSHQRGNRTASWQGNCRLMILSQTWAVVSLLSHSKPEYCIIVSLSFTQTYTHVRARAHTPHGHSSNGQCPITTLVSGHQDVKPSCILVHQEIMKVAAGRKTELQHV